jgi:hypothetical protein
MNASLYQTVLDRSCVEHVPMSIRRWSSPGYQPTSVANRAHTQLHQLKRRLLCLALEQMPSSDLFKRVCGAANEAASLAWSTGEPLLVFPCVFEELTQQLRARFTSESAPEPDPVDPAFQVPVSFQVDPEVEVSFQVIEAQTATADTEDPLPALCPA